ncbi:MAG: ribonuclease Z [Dorea sp.]|uniref:ribonuclease Z n=1 Tax=Sporofaciens musculi TaxID=2681861 RepID=UPI002170954C|nr:ribonuclease Z [Sporofaciens musculi]MCI9423227.1 ribonuclease Z [Dorea sp.]
MIVVVCVDEKNGMMFHRRRQSQDRVLRENLQKECGGKKLYMNGYSGKLFKDAVGIVVSENFLGEAKEGEFCFVEDADVGEYLQRIEAVILYRWNRRYPADVYFTLDLFNEKWMLERTEEFKGSSHERITKEVYKKI